jgi:hypothetical protein
MSNQSSASGGIGVGGLLLVLFVALKLTHQIAWSWWWVLSPMWLPLGAVAVIILGALAFALTRDAWVARKRRTA